MTNDDTAGRGIPPSLAALWGTAPRPTKGPRPGLTVERIVAAAVAVADADGLDAVSMNRIAKEIDSSPMSLYRYITGKEELLLLMVDAAFGDPTDRGPGEDWRAGLARWARGHLAAVRAHPWAIKVPIDGPPLGPNSIGWLEDGLASLGETGLAEAEKASVVLMLSGYVRNQASLMADVSEHFLSAAPTPDDAMLNYTATLRVLTDPERFPALHRVLDAGVFDRADPQDEEFDFGLERILDGIDALVRTRPAPAG